MHENNDEAIIECPAQCYRVTKQFFGGLIINEKYIALRGTYIALNLDYIGMSPCIINIKFGDTCISNR